MDLKLEIKQYIKMISQNFLLPLCYRIGCRRKMIPGLVVFADAHHDARPENMNLLYQRFSEKKSGNRIQIRECYLNYQTHGPVTVLKQMCRFMRWYAQAEYVIICDNFLPAASCRKRKSTKVIQLWHACGAFKKFGYDTEDDIPRNYHGNVFKNIDLVTVSAEACVKPFASAMRLPQQCVKPMGVSRTDIYFDEAWRNKCQSDFYRQYPQAKGKKVVLWAPTFRGNPGHPKLIEMDLKKLQKELGEEWFVLCRVHPHMHEQYKNEDCSIPTERLFAVTDVLIADYSSLIFEYLLFDGVLVLYVPDLQEYQEQRGFYLNFSEIPGYVTDREELLAETVRKAGTAGANADFTGQIQRQNQSMEEKKKQFTEKYMSECDGSATERIVNYMVEEAKK